MDFAGQIKAFKTRHTVILNRVSGNYVNGNWEEVSQTPRELIDVAVQTVSGKELQVLPENYKNSKSLKFYTLEPLLITDFLDYRGTRYKVIMDKKYDNIGDYFVNIASEEHR